MSAATAVRTPGGSAGPGGRRAAGLLALVSGSRSGAGLWGLVAFVGLSVGVGAGGCAGTRVRQVAQWEAEGDDVALKRALEDNSPEVRRAAAAAFVRYAAYDTGRPAVLGTLGKSQSPEAREAVRKLFGVPPPPTPDPHGSGARPGQVVIYLYRPAADRGEARWLRFDAGTAAVRAVRLRPGRFIRLETEVGVHRVAVELPDHEAPPTDDPNETYGQMHKTPPMQLSVATPAAGVYFVRQLDRDPSKPDVKVMPVPVGLSALSALKPVEAADSAAAP